MECKLKNIENQIKARQELIDTLWNVNEVGPYCPIFAANELIDTLWNVNLHFASLILQKRY